MLTSILPPRLTRFARDDRGYVSTEAIIVLPVMMWLFGVGWTYFDAFHQQSVNQKANYVIGDMISRETNGITGDYINSAYGLLKSLTKSNSNDTDMRAAVVQYTAEGDRWSVVWSSERGSNLTSAATTLTDADLVTYRDRLPPVTNNDQLVIVETWEDWEPAFDVGIGAFKIRTYSFTAPRYAPQIPFVLASAGANDHVTATGGSSSDGDSASDDDSSDDFSRDGHGGRRGRR